MYCPKCGTENIEGANFCRGCGADLAPVSQALSGRVPERRSASHDPEGRSRDRHERHKRRGKEPRIDKAITSAFTGLAFLVVAIILSRTPMGRAWWYWLLIPAITMIGGSIAEYVRFKHGRDREPSSPEVEPRPAAVPPARVSALPPRNTSEMAPPPSVTEGTTRHLNVKAEAPKRDT